MDPDACLKELRKNVERVLVFIDALPIGYLESETLDLAQDIATNFQSLDTWLTKGGFKPKDWADTQQILEELYNAIGE